MNPAADIQIEQDLVRWKRSKWVAAVVFVILVQVALLLLTPRSAQDLSRKYPKEPTISFLRVRAPSEWLALQDATLFASANPRGFSGLAWIRRSPRTYFPEDSLPAASFLTFTQVPATQNDESPPPIVLPNLRELPQATEPPLAATTVPAAGSHLRIEGFAGRTPLQTPALPVQYATDAVRPTVLEALLDSDGLVFSARILSSSGSRAIDNTALDLAKKARFTPSYSSGDAQLSSGKLIFDWSAVEPGQTNAVPSKNAR